MPIRTWKAEPEEAETVARLLVEFRNWWGRDWPSDNAFLAGVERLMTDAGTEFLLGAVDDDSPPSAVCQIRFRFGIWMASEDCWFEDLYVESEARGTGLGRALVEFACERAELRGSKRIELDVSEGNPEAMALYRSAGFTTKSAPDRDIFMYRALGGDRRVGGAQE